MSWLSSSICKTGIKNIDFTNRAMVQISYPSFANCFQKSSGCKNYTWTKDILILLILLNIIFSHSNHSFPSPMYYIVSVEKMA